MARNMLATLPAELRIRVYEFALPVASAVKRRAPSSEPQDKSSAEGADQGVVFLGASLLFVDRLTYQEALPIFYKANTISVRRSDLYASALEGSPGLEHVVHLHLSDSAITPSCAKPLADCTSCRESALNLLCLPPLLPRLRTVTVDYGANDQSLEAFALFKPALRAAACKHPDYTLTCTGIGQYKLLNSKRPGLEITTTHVELARSWSIATPDSVRTAGPDRDLRGSVAQRLHFLLRGHDGVFANLQGVKLIPESLARVWPGDQACDFRKVGECDGTLAFLEGFDDALLAWLKAFGVDSYREGWVPAW